MKLRRKSTIGSHSFRHGGKWVRVKPGVVIDIDPKILGSDIEGYEPVHGGQLSSDPYRAEVDRLLHIKKAKSLWLGTVDNDNRQLPLIAPSTPEGLEFCLNEWTDTGEISGSLGRVPIAQLALSDAKAEWQHKCSIDVTKNLDPKKPTGQYFDRMTEAQAQLELVEAETEEIHRRLVEALKPAENSKKRHLEKMRFKGTYRTALKYPDDKKSTEQIIVECDGRPCEQNKKDETVFRDDKSSVLKYLKECKTRRRGDDKKKREASERRAKIEVAAAEAAKKAAAKELGL